MHLEKANLFEGETTTITLNLDIEEEIDDSIEINFVL